MKVNFNEEQQVKLNELIDLAYTKAWKKAAEKYQEEIDRLNIEIHTLKNKKSIFSWRNK